MKPIEEMNKQELNAYKAHLSDYLRKMNREVMITVGRLGKVGMMLSEQRTGSIIDEEA